jgi:hypothetical protein
MPFCRIPILYNTRCVSRDTAKKVEIVLAYLIGVENSAGIHDKPRVFQKAMLPRELNDPRESRVSFNYG